MDKPFKTGRWSAAEVTLARTMRTEQGRSVKDVAVVLNRNYERVRIALSARKIKGGSKIYSAAEAKTIRTMRAAGHPFSEIAKVLPGRSINGLSKWAVENGVLLDPAARRAIAVQNAQKASAARLGQPAKRSTRAPAQEIAPNTVTRTCMACRRPFASKHVGNRRCALCLDNAQLLSSSIGY